ncbi:non-histone protein [Histoplasma capsulatum G186AR]|uniref:H/ACA ribonucleoprotein complex subunit 2 n=1 Tax=Ajellomyces capsulatus TaxID=5037 RepID=A0A8H7Z7I5_AJECA|nr:non-histone protein [Histoplasma capsulatum]QSS68835.1 non-histone protein [Histoplasma capsulatum G186AR]
MAKDKSDRERKKEKKEKKRSETDGVHKKSKKDKKKDTSLLAEAVEKELTTKVLEHLEKPDAEPAPTVTAAETTSKKPAPERIVGALVPFANPLAQDKVAKKVLKSVKKAAVNKSLKRGVKEVVKALRKSPVPAPNAVIDTPTAVVVLAADISPMDVISHIPVLCEDHGIPYVYVTSRAELGSAGATKRPTSVVMVLPRSSAKGKKDKDKKDKKDGGDGEDKEYYTELVKVAQKESKRVKV